MLPKIALTALYLPKLFSLASNAINVSNGERNCRKKKRSNTIERIQNIHEVINEIFERKKKEDPKST